MIRTLHGFLFFMLVLQLNSFGQSGIVWQKSFGGLGSDQSSAMIRTSDDGFIMVGSSESGKLINDTFDVKENFGGSDFWVIKTNSLGILQWQQHYGGTDNDVATCVIQTVDGGYLVGGFSFSYDIDISQHNPGATTVAGELIPNSDYWLLKINSIGVVQWETSLGGSYVDKSFSMIQLEDGTIVLSGFSASNNGNVVGNIGGYDYWITKLNANGQFISAKNYGGTGDDRAMDIIRCSEGGFLVVGFSSSSDIDLTENFGLYDFWLLRIDDDGHVLWQKSFGGSRDDRAYSAIETSDKGFIVAGITWSQDVYINGMHGEQDGWIIKTDKYGNLQWENTIGGSENDAILLIREDINEGYIFSGISFSSDIQIPLNRGSSDAWLSKINSSGELLWSKTFGGSGRDEFHSFFQMSDGGFTVLATSSSTDKDIIENKGYEDFLMLRLSADVGNEELAPNASGLHVFPIPSSGKLMLKNILSEFSGKSILQILDVSGRILFKDEVFFQENETHILDLNTLDNGVYFLQVLMPGKISTQKLIIQK